MTPDLFTAFLIAFAIGLAVTVLFLITDRKGIAA